MRNFKFLPLIICIPLVLSGCRAFDKGNTKSLEGAKDLSFTYTPPGKRANNRFRNMVLEETGISIGAQTALYVRAKQIDDVLKKNDKMLDRIFNFYGLMLPHSVLPPVLLEGRNTLNLAGPDAIRISDRTYRIHKQARFVTAVPNWRDFLWLKFEQPDRPHNSLLPKNRRERKVWEKAVEKGWKQGLRQGNSIFADNLAAIKQDYLGMIRYRILLAQNMVSPPFVARTELGVTGNGTHMNINDQVLRITALPQLQTNSNQWQPALTVRQLRDSKLFQDMAGKFVVDANNKLPAILAEAQASKYGYKRSTILAKLLHSYKAEQQ
jgi:defect in organelle trafficking protein DotC